MKKIAILVLVLLTLGSCARYGGKTAKQPQKQMLAGGYTDQRTPTAEELTLFKTATAELDGVGYTPETVATQVVAGKNYRFICKAVTATRKPQIYKAVVTIYQPLPGKGEPRITKIEKL